MRVFSGTTLTRPQRLTSFANSLKSAIECRLFPVRCSRKVCRAQECDWLRFATNLPHLAHFHSRARSIFRREFNTVNECFYRDFSPVIAATMLRTRVVVHFAAHFRKIKPDGEDDDPRRRNKVPLPTRRNLGGGIFCGATRIHYPRN